MSQFKQYLFDTYGGFADKRVKDINDKIALGVLLWIVAEAVEKRQG